LNLSLRSIAGIGLWRTERAAAQDAAFQAYVALHKAGLLNENLLPLSHTWALEDEDQPEDLSATVEVPAQHSPWGKLAEAWPSPDIHQTRITLKKRGLNTEDTLDMVLTTPSLIPSVPSFPLYWDESTTFILDFDTPQKVSLNNSSTLHTLRSITHTLSRSTRSGYTNDDRIDFIALFSPLLDESQLAAWFETNRGRVSAVEQFKSKSKPLGFIRTPSLRGSPHIFHRWNICNAEHGGEIEVQCIPLPRRRHFLVRNTLSKKTGPNSHQTISPKLHGFPIEDCTVDRLPFPYAQFNLFIPAILQHLEALMNADKLRKTILKDVLIKDTYHIITAISAPSAGWITDYQRYEFFGDTVLKFIVSLQLFCDNGNWHEGYLSEQKNRIVSNQRLAKAALEKGLDRYIMTHAFKSRKWAPMLVSDVQAEASGKRDISMKVLADVVEALIGAAYVDGGLDVARTCIHAFLPNIRVEAPQPNKPSITSHLDPSSSAVLKAEAIIGYHFRNKTILFEALTHPSCDRDIQIESYQRLEFLGDAVLDMLIVHFLAAHRHQTPLTQGQMSLIKVALVNAHFLGFLCLDFSCNEDTLDILQQPGGNFGTRAKTSKMHLWQIMRHSNSDILEAQNRCFARYAVLHSDITATLREGKTYPWLQLTQLNLDKFLSDMIESLVGAIFVDSEGSFTACESFLERIGLMPYLRRLVSGKVDISHVQMALELLTSVESVQYDVQAEAKPSSVERDGVQLV
jgi:dsRNA-specific ribonuclease